MYNQLKTCFHSSSQCCTINWKHISIRTVLDSTPFIIFINGLDNEIESAVIKFADDTRLGKAASTLEDQIRI